MRDDEERTTFPERGQHIFNEKVEREGGVFIEPPHDQVDCNSEDAECAPDEYPEDPFAIDNRPGTVDDVGYSMGVELPNADDEHLITDRGPRRLSGEPAPDEEPELELGERDERDLWRRQRPLIEEDTEEGTHVPADMDEEGTEDMLDAMGAEFTEEDQADISATGAPTAGEDHGGFPEREDQ